jgi:Zn-dependent M16 (insulinase) family peptidase
MTEGDKLHGYTVNRVTEVPEFDLVAVQLTHDKTSARHLHLARNDSNNVFGVGFRTTPLDSTGVAHILEHTVLCGSRKYPVRDPFFKMMNRSLATFMNAYTASDWTLYPFSTQNVRDYYNLMSVYMDSVFYPLLREMDFRQEGWRLEHEDPTEANSPIIFKGVVFNEMKGVFTSPENVYAQMAQNLLYPSYTYSHISGGDPIRILDLSWEQLKSFHTMHYHPSNSRFFTYGNFPLARHLEFINSEALQNFEQTNLCTEVPLEPRWTRPREHYTVGPKDTLSRNSDRKSFVGVSFLLSLITDSYSSLVLSVLSQLLVDGPASPFYQSLIDSNIGAEYTPNTGYDNSTKEASFSVGLQGVQHNDVDAVKNIIWNTLEKVSREGFAQERVSSVLHQIELGLKHQTSKFGLSLIMALVSPWIHDGHPTDFLRVNHSIERFKEESQRSTFWSKCIDQYFLNNKHRLTLVMTEDEQYTSTMQKQEAQKRTAIVSALSDQQKKGVFERGLELLEEQDHHLNHIDTLPSLQLSDVNRSIQPTFMEHEYADGVPVQYSEQLTNNLTYFRALSGISLLPEDLKVYVPLFCTAITQFGTENYDYRQFSQLCDQYTGGLDVSSHVSAHYNDLMTMEQGVLFSSYSLDDNLPYMLNLWEDLFCRCAPYQEQRLRTIINIAANNAAMSVSNSGHILAVRSASSGLTPSASMSEIFSGLTQVKFLKELSELEDLSDVVHKLACVAAEVLDCGSLRCAVNTGKSSLSTVYGTMDAFVQSLPGKYADMSSLVEVHDFSVVKKEMNHQFGFPVNYVGFSIKTVPYQHKDSPRYVHVSI